MSIVQSGWRVDDRDGRRIGTVIERDGDSIIVKLEGRVPDDVAIPTRLIAEEDESGKLAILAMGWGELDDATASWRE